MSFSIDIFHAAQPLFGAAPGSGKPHAKSQALSLEKLVAEAKTGNETAIELLTNFAAGSGEPAALRADAENALLNIYATPGTGEATRELIAGQAYMLYELTESVRKHQGASLVSPGNQKTQSPPLQIPFKLLFLAGTRARDRGYIAVKDNISKVLDRAITNGKAGYSDAKNYLDRGYESTEPEMKQACKDLAAVKTSRTALKADDHAEAKIHIGKLIAGLPEKACAAAFLQMDGHWLPLIFQKSGAGLECFVFDSNASSEMNLLNKTRDFLQAALGQNGSRLHYSGSLMQEHLPNACGALASYFVLFLEERLKQEPAAELKQVIADYRQHWNGLDTLQQDAIVTGRRCLMIAEMASRACSNSRFPIPL